MQKYNIDYIRNYLRDRQCELITNEYKNTTTKLVVKCQCGNIFYRNFNNLRKSTNCITCARKNAIDTNMKLYGVGNVFASDLIKSKIKKTNLEKYGKEIIGKYTYNEVKTIYESVGCKLISNEYKNAHEILEFICKCGNIHKSRFYHFKNGKGHNCKDCRIKQYEDTNLKLYNVKNPSQSQVVKDKKIQTSLKNYGTEHPSQNSEYMSRINKNNKLFKEFIFPSGNIIKVQGYENIALQVLCNNYVEDDIITSRKFVPKIKYYYKNKNRIYFPDIYLKSENKIIEVKSSRTFNIKRIQNTIKALATRQHGFDFEFWIYYDVRKDDTPNIYHNKHYLKLYKL